MSRKRVQSKPANASVSAVLEAAPQNQNRLTLYLAIGLCVLTLSVFLQATNFGFITLDDDLYVFNNPTIQKGFSADGLAYAFTAQNPYWHPLTWMSHMLDCQLFGLSAGWHHMTSVVIHCANVVVLLLLLIALTGAVWRSAFVAALFAIHPLHVESVAWIAERKDLLSCLFWLLTIWAYVGYVKGPDSKRKYVLAFAFFLLAVMSKPTVVTLPFVLLLLDYWPLERLSMLSAWPRVREKIPFFLLSLISGFITYLGQKNVGAIYSIGLGSRIANALTSYVLYLRDLAWPQSLGVLYPLPPRIPAADVLIAVMILAAITGLALRFARESPYFPVGWFYYLGVLVPMIGIIQVGQQARADRFTYIPAIGIFLLAVWAGADLIQRYRSSRTALVCCSAVILVGFAAKAWSQTAYWRSSEAIETHTIAITGVNPVLKNNLGSALNSENRLREAEQYYRSAVAEAPEYGEAYTNLGINLLQQQRWADALDALNQAIRLKPDNAPALYQRGVALLQLKRSPEAIQSFQDALRYNLTPVFYVAVAHTYLGQLFLQKGQNDTALREFDTALQLNPDLIEARVNRALVLAALGRMQESSTELSRLRTSNPNDERIARAWQYVQTRMQTDAK